VQVTGEVAAVQAESSSLGSVISEKIIDTQPLKGRSSLFPPAIGEVSVDGVSNTVNVGRGLHLSLWAPSTGAVGEIKMLMGTLPPTTGGRPACLRMS